MNEMIKRVSQSETVTRFIFSENHYSMSDGGRVKYAAYLPHNGETSVFRIDTLKHNEIWRIGEDVGSLSDRRLRARGDLLVENILIENLDVIEETSQHPLHANIIGWPTEKVRRKRIARKLADSATLLLRP